LKKARSHGQKGAMKKLEVTLKKAQSYVQKGATK
jgi:hypothetical protein